jgi:hypothetical protein
METDQQANDAVGWHSYKFDSPATHPVPKSVTHRPERSAALSCQISTPTRDCCRQMALAALSNKRSEALRLACVLWEQEAGMFESQSSE